MNERMRDLVLKAQTQAAKETIENSSSYEGKVFEKFASLIARRCMDIASSEALKIAEIDDGRDTFAASIATAGKIGREIGLEFDLFGVQE